MSGTSHATTRKVVWTILIVLGIAHQDVWFWDDRTLVLGFMPIGLAYHLGFSVVAGLMWFTAVKFAWPSHIEEWADEFDAPAPAKPQAIDSKGTHK